MIQHGLHKCDIEKDEWLAIAFDRDWFLGQFVERDEDEDKLKFNFVEKSSLSSSNTFVWPELSGKQPDTSWIEKGDYLVKFIIIIQTQQKL